MFPEQLQLRLTYWLIHTSLNIDSKQAEIYTLFNMCAVCQRRQFLEEEQETLQTSGVSLHAFLAAHNKDKQLVPTILAVIANIRKQLEAVEALLHRMDTEPLDHFHSEKRKKSTPHPS